MFNGVMGGAYRVSEWIFKFALLNILWLIFTSLGLILFGFFPATTALFMVIRKWVQQKTDIPVYKTFWQTYKKEFLKSNLLGIILCVIGYVLYLDFQLITSLNSTLIQITYWPLMLTILVYLLTLLYIFPIFVQYDIKIVHVFKNAFLIMIMRPFTTIIMVAGTVLTYLLMRLIPGLIPFFSLSLWSYILMWACNKTLIGIEHKKHNSENMLKKNS